MTGPHAKSQILRFLRVSAVPTETPKPNNDPAPPTAKD